MTVAKGIEPAFEGGSIKYLIIPVEDLSRVDLTMHFESAFSFIDESLKNEGNVLVHCANGISRSPSIVMSYLMLKDKKLRYSDAFELVSQKRPCINPNSGFRQ